MKNFGKLTILGISCLLSAIIISSCAKNPTEPLPFTRIEPATGASLGSINGRVVNNESSAMSAASSGVRSAAEQVYLGVPDALVELRNSETVYSATSDQNGYFEITNVPCGEYNMTVTKKNSLNVIYWKKQKVTVCADTCLPEVVITRSPIIYYVKVNGEIIENYWQGGNETVVKVGEQVTFEVCAEDPNNRPLQYRFSSSARNPWLVRDWSEDNKYTHTFLASDDVQYHKMEIDVRNDDEIEYVSPTQGDAMADLFFDVDTGLEIPRVDSVEVLFGGAVTGQRAFNAGDTVTIRINAADPKGLPLEYKFQRHTGTYHEASWTTSNEITYTFQDEDDYSLFHFEINVRNNDGHDFINASQGDTMDCVYFSITSPYQHPAISSAEIYSDGVLSTSRNFHVGDTITIKVNAADPLGLPLEYQFGYFGQIQSWSASNEATYTFQPADENLVFQIEVAVKNNDGHYYVSQYQGDDFKQISFNITVE